MAPKAAPPTTLPAIRPAFGGVGSADGVTVTVATASGKSVTAEAGPLLPVNLRIPARAVDSPAEVKRMVSVRAVVLSVQW